MLRDLFLGRRRFDEIQESLGVASNVLSQRLATLVEEGIAERRRYSEHPERFEYRLTEKGRDLQPVLLALLRWGDRYTADEAGAPLETVHRDCGKPFHMVPTCSECGGEVRPATTSTAAPAPAPTTSSAAATPSGARPELGAGADRRLRLPRPRARGAAARRGLGGARDEPARGGAGGDRGGRDRAGAGRSRAPGDACSTWSATSPSSYWLLGSAEGEPENLEAIHGPRLERLLERLVETPVRGFVYEADGSVDPEILAGGAALVERAAGEPGGSRSRSCARQTCNALGPGTATRSPDGRTHMAKLG